MYADKLLARLLGVNEGDHVSYADLSRGLHKYIKENNLKNAQVAVTLTPALTPKAVTADSATLAVVSEAARRRCRYCGEEIPVEAFFCDLCGAQQ